MGTLILTLPTRIVCSFSVLDLALTGRFVTLAQLCQVGWVR